MEKDTAESVTKRRRRRGRAPVEVVARASMRLRPCIVHDFGLLKRCLRSAYLLSFAHIFLGSIVTILAFLLYNESLTNELREQEKNRVGLYARLISFAPLAVKSKR